MNFHKVKLYFPAVLDNKDIQGGEEEIVKKAPRYYETNDIHKQYITSDYWPFYDNNIDGEELYKPTLSYDQINHRLPYKRENFSEMSQFLKALKIDMFNGQRKLFISELQAMNAMFSNYEESGLIIYFGCAPNFHIWYLMQLYPNVKFLLVDVNEFFIYDGRYDLPHYVRQDDVYVAQGQCWGVYKHQSEREFNKNEYVYLSASKRNTFESRYYKQKNIIWYNPETGKLEKKNKPFDNSGLGISIKRIGEERGEAEMLTNKVTQASIDYVFDGVVNTINNPYRHMRLGGDSAAKPNHRVYFIEEFFSDKIAEYIANASVRYPKVKVAFWSDVRTTVNLTAIPGDIDIILNSAWMYTWLRIIKPTISVLKFRIPYFNDPESQPNFDDFKYDFDKAAELGYDFRAPTWKEGKFYFFKGKFMIQPWAKIVSTETRLVVTREDVLANNLVPIDLKEYEEKFMYYNIIDRIGLCHDNRNSNLEIGFDNCNDCAIENVVWSDYKRKNPNFDIYAGIKTMEGLLHVPIKMRRGVFTHGGLMVDTTIRDFMKFIETSNYDLPHATASDFDRVNITGGKEEENTGYYSTNVRYYDTDDIHKQYIQPKFWPFYNKNIDKDKVLEPTITYDDIKLDMAYARENPKEYSQFLSLLKSTVHIGQRKLFISELQAMNALFDNMYDSGLIIYAGSAPSMKLWYMMQLYPNAKFLLVDPNEFFIYDGRYDLPHYVRQDREYITNGDKWGVYKDIIEREDNQAEYVYLSYSNSNMYESRFYKYKNILYYDPESRMIEQRHKPFTNSGYGKSARNIGNHTGEFTMLSRRADQQSINYVFECVNGARHNIYTKVSRPPVYEGGEKGEEDLFRDVYSTPSSSYQHRVFFIEEYFTTNIAEYIANASKRYPHIKTAFWSDIRTNLDMSDSPSDLDVILNTAWMYSWLRIMNPTNTMLKFRLPFFSENRPMDFNRFKSDFDKAAELGCDFRTPTWKEGYFPYFKGIINLQAWEGPHSTETRLLVKKEDIENNVLVKYNLKEYEDKFMYYNVIERMGLFHINENANLEKGFDNCNDCAIENRIWMEYKTKNPSFNILEGITIMESILHVPIKSRFDINGHGFLFMGTTNEDLIEELDKSDYTKVKRMSSSIY